MGLLAAREEGYLCHEVGARQLDTMVKRYNRLSAHEGGGFDLIETDLEARPGGHKYR